MPLELLETVAPKAADKDYLWTLNFGPQHPATHTTLRLILTLDGETVVKAVPDIGYLHSGFEKLGEDLDYNQYVTIVDRMNYISPVANEIAWHHAVEKLLGIELTPRCKYIRTILAELARISDHLLCVGAAALDLGGVHRVPVRLQPAREDLRHLRDGVRPAVPSELHARRRPDVRRRRRLDRARSATSSRRFPKAHADVVRLLNRNRIFIDRTKGIGVLSKEEAINRELHRPDRPGQRRRPRPAQGRAVPGLQGLRFQGRSAPTAGDCYARYLVRMEEMLESLKIIHAGDREPAGRAGQRGRRQARRCCRTRRRSTAASRG